MSFKEILVVTGCSPAAPHLSALKPADELIERVFTDDGHYVSPSRSI